MRRKNTLNSNMYFFKKRYVYVNFRNQIIEVKKRMFEKVKIKKKPTVYVIKFECFTCLMYKIAMQFMYMDGKFDKGSF